MPQSEYYTMGKSMPSVMDSVSMANLMWQTYFNRYFRLQLGRAERALERHIIYLTYTVPMVGAYPCPGMLNWTLIFQG